MYKNLEEILSVLKTDERLLSQNGDLLLNKSNELALKNDPKFIKTLFNNKTTRDYFFIDIEDMVVFNPLKFSWFLENEATLPDSYTSFSQEIGLIDKKKNKILSYNDVVLSFPFKDCILEFDSTDPDKKREEIYFNEVLAKEEIDRLLDLKALGNAYKYGRNSKVKINQITEATDNLLIKGNNLIAMYSLLPRYKGQVKLIYWDILYNTDNDLVNYNDSFKHSSWLVMMKNRIQVAKGLLKDDGLIFIHCDKNEDAYLKVLMDEVFGRENYVNNIAVKSNSISGNKTRFKEKTILKNKDTILVYKGNGDIKINPQYTEKLKWDTHYNAYLDVVDEKNNIYNPRKLKDVLIEEGIIDSKTTVKEDIINNNPEFLQFCLENKDKIYRLVNSIPADKKKESLEKKYQVISYTDSNGETRYALNGSRISFLSSAVKNINGEEKLAQLLGDLWTDIDFQNTQNEGGKENSLPAGKKPEKLLKRIIEMATDEDDLVLDAYSGSGTTAAVALKLNRKFIAIEQLDKHYEISLNRLNLVVNGDESGIANNMREDSYFISCEILSNSQNFVEKIIATDNHEILNSLYEELYNSEFVSYRIDFNNLKNGRNDFEEFSIEDKKALLLSVIDKNTLYINASEIEDSSFNLREDDKLFTKSFYKGLGGENLWSTIY
ncbi:DNA methyltransferase [Sporolactobacillus kofuensis]|uniref:DNA methyltransferase n=1 Tax=Sporolactobacillus kofuensis TaxID=269672 RepID=A0ABW1WF05_9BACL|nr:site-specific DNA-methyltransferase [Sporolactobacillus kofuensis]MCO7176501.1 site-specific DNA-methyltransferase [Sporolactobacillus kofuensis]